MKARERKRAKMVEKYAAKRAALKAAGDWDGLQKLPANSSKVNANRVGSNQRNRRILPNATSYATRASSAAMECSQRVIRSGKSVMAAEYRRSRWMVCGTAHGVIECC